MVNSFVWTDEEARYLKAVLKWKENDARSDDDDKIGGRRLAGRENNTEKRLEQQKPAGELRILVIGAKGTGKTSILTRFATGTFPGEGEPPDPFYERGCRHRIELDSSLSFPGQIAIQSPSQVAQAQAKAQDRPRQTTQTYVIDALEMPSKHLPSDPMLEQALNITEAGVLVYDVRDPKSLQLALGIAEFVKEYLDKVNAAHHPPANEPPPPPLPGQLGPRQPGPTGYNNQQINRHRRREYPLILVGNKSDVDDEERSVSWSEGSKAAARISSSSSSSSNVVGQSPCPFLEVSAKTGDNVDVIFPRLARDILKNKWVYQQQQLLQRQRELAQQGQGQGQQLLGKSSLYSSSGGSGGVKNRKKGFWRTLTAPCFGRGGGGGSGGR